MSTFDAAMRVRLFSDFVRDGRAPSAEQLARDAGSSVLEVRAALERMAAGKALVLQPESRDILMANPLSAVPTPYLVRVEERFYFGSCVWDGLGVITMLGKEWVLESSCACCGEASSHAARR